MRTGSKPNSQQVRTATDSKLATVHNITPPCNIPHNHNFAQPFGCIGEIPANPHI